MPELPEELVEKAARTFTDAFSGPEDWTEALRISRAILDAIDLSSILRERDEAKGHVKALLGEIEKHRKVEDDLKARLEAAEGERDQAKAEAIREVVAALRKDWSGYSADFVEVRFRAALSTGDRQEQHLGVRTGVPTQPGIAGQDSEGGETA